MKCVTTSSLSFLVNGVVKGSIRPSRGLRQGDPLSPYLFLLCAEGLSSLLRAHQSEGLFKGVAISRRAPSISHLLFADDSLIFCSTDRDSCSSLRDIFQLYCQASGRAINFAKSSILFSPNIPQDIRNLFFTTFDLKDRPFISKYLGLPQCLSQSKYHSFTFLKDKVLSVLTNWSNKWFSKAGKEILLKAVIQAIPAYAMAYFRLPVKLCKGIEAAVARFWWDSSGNSRKIHWKSWKKEYSLGKRSDGFWSYLEGKDDIVWSGESFGFFSVKSAYQLALSNQDIPSSSFAFNSKKFWNAQQANQLPSASVQLQSKVLDIVEEGSLQVYTDAAIDPHSKKYSYGIVLVDEFDQVKAGIAKPCVGNAPAVIAKAKAIHLAI
uniref:Reverse transcriptase domain-containing protein n=1 Tax=Cannabis sativa TaxID=3483 RepID=A0A803PBN7_CANSA